MRGAAPLTRPVRARTAHASGRLYGGREAAGARWGGGRRGTGSAPAPEDAGKMAAAAAANGAGGSSGMEVDAAVVPSVMAAGVTGSVSVALHPLVILNISDHWIRMRSQEGRPVQVIGALIGRQEGRNIEVMNSFELLSHTVEEKIVIDKEYYYTKEEQFKQVFKELEFLGWYTTGGLAPRVSPSPPRPPLSVAVCKYLSSELQGELGRSSGSREVLELGQVLDTGGRKRRVPYSTSETRLEEALDHLCDRILDYKVHAERKGSLRYAKGQSETMTTLKNLVQRGVKVDLGIPPELWDEPSVEVTHLKQQCETMLERFEDVVEDWYFRHQGEPLQAFLCEGHVLKEGETACLQETWTGKDEEEEGEEEEREGKERPVDSHHDPSEF
ncbi:protein canopy homolog 4 [Ornithorhynchus anatinus]|uniref:protein canopy homolog 4 n=1 Tax=Ornithorhynchus anatinus TaxID=9258 RepID=UPI0010A7D923|nr:protein canopy homolog 4 [Ornithorhynchus anatinus]